MADRRGWQHLFIALGVMLVPSWAVAEGAPRATRPCSIHEAQAAEVASVIPRTWRSLHALFLRFAHCDDGAIAEGFSDSVGRLLAGEDGRLRELLALCARDHAFGQFIVRHADATLSDDVLVKALRNVRRECARVHVDLCQGLELQLEQAGAAQAHRAADPGAATQGLDWPVVQFDASGTECQEVLPATARTLLGIPLDRSHLGAFERVLGASPLRKQGDAGEYFEWRCWEAANGDGTVLVVGQGEVDAQVRVLGRGMAFAGRGECPSSKRVDRSLALGNDLRLGLTRGDLERKVGPATAAGAGWYDRTCLGKRPMTAKERSATGAGATGAWDVSSRLTVVEVEGRAEGIRVVWAATY